MMRIIAIAIILALLYAAALSWRTPAGTSGVGACDAQLENENKIAEFLAARGK